MNSFSLLSKTVGIHIGIENCRHYNIDEPDNDDSLTAEILAVSDRIQDTLARAPLTPELVIDDTGVPFVDKLVVKMDPYRDGIDYIRRESSIEDNRYNPLTLCVGYANLRDDNTHHDIAHIITFAYADLLYQTKDDFTITPKDKEYYLQEITESLFLFKNLRLSLDFELQHIEWFLGPSFYRKFPEVNFKLTIDPHTPISETRDIIKFVEGTKQYRDYTKTLDDCNALAAVTDEDVQRHVLASPIYKKMEAFPDFQEYIRYLEARVIMGDRAFKTFMIRKIREKYDSMIEIY